MMGLGAPRPGGGPKAELYSPPMERSSLLSTLRRPYALAREALGYLIFERRPGVYTAGRVNLRDLGLEAEGRNDSTPSAWLPLRRLLPPSTVGSTDVFCDFGSGKGRVVCQAAKYRFARVIGVELSEELNRIARENVARHRTVRAGRVEIVTADVLDWPIPDDLSVAYFYNPFVGEIFHTVVTRLIESFDRHPRRLRILYVNPREHQYLLSTGRIRPVRHLRGWRPGKEWSRSHSAWLYVVSSQSST
jgi:SAM-dependent methyltransferase